MMLLGGVLLLLGCVLIPVVSGVISIHLDIDKKVKDPTVYWLVGAIGGVISGVLMGVSYFCLGL